MAKDTIDITIAVKRQTLLDLLVTAVEGGSNYWADFGNVTQDEELNYTRVRVTEKEAHDDDVKRINRYVDANDMARGVERLGQAAATEAFPSAGLHFAAALGAHDAGTADVVLQMAIFGDVIYG